MIFMQKATFFPNLPLPVKKHAPSNYEKPSKTKTFIIYTINSRTQEYMKTNQTAP